MHKKELACVHQAEMNHGVQHDEKADGSIWTTISRANSVVDTIGNNKSSPHSVSTLDEMRDEGQSAAIRIEER